MNFYIPPKTDDEKIALMVTAFFSYNLITLLINTIVNFFVPNTPIDTAICAIVYACFIIVSISPVLRRATAADGFVILCSLVLYLFHCIIFPANTNLLLNYFPKFFLTVLPLYLLGRATRDFDIVLKYLEKVSNFIIIISFAYYVILIASGQELKDDNMSFAYYLLPFVVISFYTVIKKFSLMTLLKTILAVSTLLLTGTRGPLLCLSVAVILLVLFYQNTIEKKIIWSFVLVGFIVFLFSNTFLDLIESLNRFLLNHDIENRIIYKILEENLLDDTGRGFITDTLLEAIKKQPILGYGIMGDRVLTGSYAHNLLYELIIDFGVVIGLVLFSIILGFVVKNVFMHNTSDSYKIIFIMLVSCIFVKLFISGSYIQEPNFFLLLGVLFADKNASSINEGC